LSQTINELITNGEKILRDAGVEDHKIDAEALLAFVTGFDKKTLFLNRVCEVSDEQYASWIALLNRRASGEPLQYIIGEQFFMGHRFSVSPSVLIPRPETEILADKAIKYISENDVKNALDLCTGSGALAISIAKACPRVKITASDISEKALSVAKQNAKDLDVSDQVDYVESDLFSALSKEVFDLIITNPPYIKTDDLAGLSREIREYEPLSALDGGADGLDFYRRIAMKARAFMSAGACLMTEIGADQANSIASIFTDAGFTAIEIIKDYNDLDRLLILF